MLKHSRTILYLLVFGLIALVATEIIRPGTIFQANKPTENLAQPTALGLSAAYAQEEAFVGSVATLPAFATPDYVGKARCRYEYQLTGMLILSQVLAVQEIEITHPASVPGGYKAEGGIVVDTDPWLVDVRILSNRPLSMPEMQSTVKPPAGWFAGDWSKDERYAPRYRTIYQNCATSWPVEPAKELE